MTAEAAELTTVSVIAALVIGFLVTLAQQSYIIEIIGLPDFLKGIAFTWQLCIGTTIAFMICLMGNDKK